MSRTIAVNIIHTAANNTKLDQAQGLIPFAVSLNSDLAQLIQARAPERQLGLNEMIVAGGTRVLTRFPHEFAHNFLLGL